jgi:hypothetical protein
MESVEESGLTDYTIYHLFHLIRQRISSTAAAAIHNLLAKSRMKAKPV